MNPESRIKLVRSLEDIRVFEMKNYESRFWKISAWGVITIYFGVILFQVISKIVESDTSIILVIYLPIVLLSAWLLLRKQLNDKYKLLANAILELGSIAQESPVAEIVSQKIGPKSIKVKKQITKRKKK